MSFTTENWQIFALTILTGIIGYLIKSNIDAKQRLQDEIKKSTLEKQEKRRKAVRAAHVMWSELTQAHSDLKRFVESAERVVNGYPDNRGNLFSDIALLADNSFPVVFTTNIHVVLSDIVEGGLEDDPTEEKSLRGLIQHLEETFLGYNSLLKSIKQLVASWPPEYKTPMDNAPERWVRNMGANYEMFEKELAPSFRRIIDILRPELNIINDLIDYFFQASEKILVAEAP